MEELHSSIEEKKPSPLENEPSLPQSKSTLKKLAVKKMMLAYEIFSPPVSERINSTV